MAEQTELIVAQREKVGKAAKHLRKAGLIPANIYGHKEESQAVQIDALAFEALRRARKTSGIIALRMDNGSNVQTALVRHVQRNPVNGKISTDFSMAVRGRRADGPIGHGGPLLRLATVNGSINLRKHF